MVSEAAKPPAVMRAKLERPLACGVCCAGTSLSWMVIIETKKVLIATPWTSMGRTRTLKLTSGVRAPRIRKESPKANSASVPVIRASIRAL